MNWKDVYKLPLFVEQACPFMIMTEDRQRAFDFAWPVWGRDSKWHNTTDELKHLIVDKLNGDSSIVIEDLYNFQYDGNGMIKAFSLKYRELGDVIMIRGWGHLTGIGGLHLTDKEACKIQDDFAKWICETLNH